MPFVELCPKHESPVKDSSIKVFPKTTPPVTPVPQHTCDPPKYRRSLPLVKVNVCVCERACADRASRAAAVRGAAFGPASRHARAATHLPETTTNTHTHGVGCTRADTSMLARKEQHALAHTQAKRHKVAASYATTILIAARSSVQVFALCTGGRRRGARRGWWKTGPISCSRPRCSVCLCEREDICIHIRCERELKRKGHIIRRSLRFKRPNSNALMLVKAHATPPPLSLSL
jgi:hypothetical protein